MDVIVMQVFVSMLLVIGGVVLFVFSVKKRTFDHADRLALLPLEKEEKKNEHG
jgi:hypothetical protein